MTTRTTITIDEGLLDRLKIRAAKERTTVSQVIEQDLRLGEAQHTQRENPGRARFQLPTFDLGEPKPGVELNDNAALLDAMDSRE